MSLTASPVRRAMLPLLTLMVAVPVLAEAPGLVGLVFEKPDFREPASKDVVKHLDHEWTGGPGDWSARWRGWIEGPVTGEVRFFAEADNGLRLEIDGRVVIDGLGRDAARSGRVSMVAGRKAPLRIAYFQDGDPSYLRLYWSWSGQPRTLVDPAALSYGPEDEREVMEALPEDYWDPDEAPLRVTAEGSEWLDLSYQDGRLAPVVGVESRQVFRADREHPERSGELPFTYNHAPMLAYWNGRFYLEFLAAPRDEHQDPTVTLLTTSIDGRRWSAPRVVFPAFTPEGDDHRTVAHQRMGFYVPPDGERLLVLAFYGRWPSPNEGLGVGRVVRQVDKEGRLGPIYFIRYNRHAGWNETNTPYPFFRDSPDTGFVRACEALLADKLRVQQWWEEDRSEDGFYLLGGGGFEGKAFTWYTRADGVVVGLWKAGYAASSADGGRTWTERRKLPSVIVGHAKMWAQATDDGRYAFVYNPHFEWRYPLALHTSADGRTFGDMACVHCELPDTRYQGGAKDIGPQYVRGITPGNGDAPGDDLWLVYSVNKEDIWISRVPVPIRSRVEAWVDDGFDTLIPGGPVDRWNVYAPRWAPVDVVEHPSVVDKSLRLADAEPWDYARAVRVFPEAPAVELGFRLQPFPREGGRLEVEVLGRSGQRPVRIALTDTGWIQARRGEETVDLRRYEAGQWLSFELKVRSGEATWDLAIDGRAVLEGAALAEPAAAVERLSFRTGEYRRLGRGLGLGRGEDVAPDRPGAGERVPESVFHVDDVSVVPLR